MLHRTVTIIEQADGRWLWAEYDRTYKTLTRLLQVEQRHASGLAELYGAVLTVRTVRPNTSAGHTIAAACLASL